MGHNIRQKEKKLVTKQYDKKLLVCPLLCSNESFWEIFYMRVICNLLLKHQTKGWKFRTPCQTCLSSPSLRVLGGVKNWLEISTTTLFSSKVVPVYSLSLFELTQHNVSRMTKIL